MISQQVVEACIVRLSEIGGNNRTGTGFFVAPGIVLTCAHVVEPPNGKEICSFRVSGGFGTAEAIPEQLRPDGLADLAILRIGQTKHPVVLLSGAAEIGDQVWTQGYIARQSEIRLEPVTGEIEGERRAKLESGGPEYTLIKFKGGQIIPGMSGAPLLNRRTGSICGAVVRTLNENAALGGLAVPFRVILACYPELSDEQSAYHRANPTWRSSNIVLPSPDLTERQKAESLLDFPEGPGVLLAVVPMEIITVFYGLDPTLSEELVQEANNFRLRSRRSGAKVYTITLILPKAATIGVVDYWRQAFAGAAAKGPRMLAALLYAAPPGTFEGIEDIVLDFLATLRTWPIV